MSRLSLAALGALDRDALARVARAAGVDPTGRSESELRSAIASIRRLDLAGVLASLNRRELEELCEALLGSSDVDDATRELGLPRRPRRSVRRS